MSDKSTLSITKGTAELVKEVRRQLNYNLHKDLTIDETVSELCRMCIEKFENDKNAEKEEAVEGKEGEREKTDDS